MKAQITIKGLLPPGRPELCILVTNMAILALRVISEAREHNNSAILQNYNKPLAELPKAPHLTYFPTTGPKIAIPGRPNVGEDGLIDSIELELADTDSLPTMLESWKQRGVNIKEVKDNIDDNTSRQQ